MREALEHLIAGEDFDSVLEEYHLNKYELLTSLRDEVVSHKQQFLDEQKEQLKTIYLDCCSMVDLHEETVVFVSDTHFSGKYECPDYFTEVLKFCRENHISYLFHGGDIGDGMIQPGLQYSTALKQLNHIIDVYPDDSRIKQFVLGANHDSKYQMYGIDLLKVLATHKKKIYPMGYVQSYFTVFDYPISFEHHCTIRPQYRLISLPFMITGHAHKSRFGDDYIKLPTLSNDIHHKKFLDGLPGFIVMKSRENNAEEFSLDFFRYTFSDEGITCMGNPHTYQFIKRKRPFN